LTAALGKQRIARAVLTYLAEPGDQVLGALLRACEPAEIVTAVTEGRIPAACSGIRPSSGMSGIGRARLEQAVGTWRNRLGGVPSEMDLAGFHRNGIRLVCPEEAEWPTQLDVLGGARPYALWLRGEADLRYCCLRSVSIVGARAATAYGAHVGTEMAAALGERGWTVVSGGAYGIDGCAHRGALAAEAVTVAVLACGVDYAYPRGHQDLLAGIAAQGVLVSEWPPGRTPTRRRFLIRNRVIGALSRGTVVVEAGMRSGALNTARHARDLGRPVMAVPGPVTSDVSAGCHKIIREWGAVCVTSARDVIELLGPLGDEVPGCGLPGERQLAGAQGPPGPDLAAAEHGSRPSSRNGQHGSGQQCLWPEEQPRGLQDTLGQESRPVPGEPDAQEGPHGEPGPDGHMGPGRPHGPHAQNGTRLRQRGPVLARDALDGVTTEVLEAVPVRGAGPATIAVSAGLSVDAVMRSLGLLAAGGFVERCPRGWRIRRYR
jgi:DNA processing protein